MDGEIIEEIYSIQGCNLKIVPRVQVNVITREREETLIDQVLGGDEGAYAHLIDAHKSYAYTIAYKILLNRPEAEEAAQDAFIKAFQYLRGFNRSARFSTWLYRIVFNTAISYKRRRKGTFQDINSAVGLSGDVGGRELDRSDSHQHVHAALAGLNEADQLAIQLFYLQEMDLQEVAGIMGQPVNTVKVRIHRARLRLADELKRMLKEEALTL